MEGEFVDGKKNGLFKNYMMHKLYQEIHYVMDAMHGRISVYTDNWIYCGYMKKNLFDGKATLTYKDGKVE